MLLRRFVQRLGFFLSSLALCSFCCANRGEALPQYDWHSELEFVDPQNLGAYSQRCFYVNGQFNAIFHGAVIDPTGATNRDSTVYLLRYEPTTGAFKETVPLNRNTTPNVYNTIFTVEVDPKGEIFSAGQRSAVDGAFLTAGTLVRSPRWEKYIGQGAYGVIMGNLVRTDGDRVFVAGPLAPTNVRPRFAVLSSTGEVLRNDFFPNGLISFEADGAGGLFTVFEASIVHYNNAISPVWTLTGSYPMGVLLTSRKDEIIADLGGTISLRRVSDGGALWNRKAEGQLAANDDSFIYKMLVVYAGFRDPYYNEAVYKIWLARFSAANGGFSGLANVGDRFVRLPFFCSGPGNSVLFEGIIAGPMETTDGTVNNRSGWAAIVGKISNFGTPILKGTRTRNSLRLSWPWGYREAVLETAISVTGPFTKSTLLITYDAVNLENGVDLQMTNKSTYFRLASR